MPDGIAPGGLPAVPITLGAFATNPLAINTAVLLWRHAGAARADHPGMGQRIIDGIGRRPSEDGRSTGALSAE